MDFGVLVILLGVSLVGVVLKFAIAHHQTTWSEGRFIEGEPTRFDHEGHSIVVEHLYIDHGPHTERTFFTGYRIALPPALAGLGLVDIDAQQRWSTTNQYGRIETAESPQTSDDIFNGTFELTYEHTDASALRLAEVRETLIEVSETCRGVWTRNGELCVLDAGHYSAAEAEIVGEYLVAQVERLRRAVEKPGRVS